MICYEEQNPDDDKCLKRALEAYYNLSFDHWDYDSIKTNDCDKLLQQLGFCIPYLNEKSLTAKQYTRNRNYICIYFTHYVENDENQCKAHAICVNDINFCFQGNIYINRLYFLRKGNILQQIWWKMQRVRLLGK